MDQMTDTITSKIDEIKKDAELKVTFLANKCDFKAISISRISCILLYSQHFEWETIPNLEFIILVRRTLISVVSFSMYN